MTTLQSPIPLVLLPGYMLDESLWSEVAQCMDQTIPSHAFRLEPGTTTEEIAESIASAAPERFVLAGFSMGGYVARKVAELYPQRVAGLILVATSMRVDSESKKQSKKKALSAMSPGSFQGFSNAAVAQSLHPALRDNEKLVKRIRNMGIQLGYESLVIQSGLQRDGIAAASLTCPTLVIAAADDSLRTLQESEELIAAIPNSTLKVIENSGHMLPIEQPRHLAKLMETFVVSLS